MIDYIEKAKAFAMMAHKGQTDKAGEDYFTAHVAVVADGVEPDQLVKTAAYLHDTVEDTGTTIDTIRAEFPQEVAETVSVLTRKKDMTYAEYIWRVKQNDIAVKVKRADLVSNMDLNRIPYPLTSKDLAREAKYLRAYKMLDGRKTGSAVNPYALYDYLITCGWENDPTENSDAKRQLSEWLNEVGFYVVNYIGYCADEERRSNKRLSAKKLEIYPLAENGINEDVILEWAKTQPIFNNYYKTNKRCGCMYCPMSSFLNFAYLYKYYPENFRYMLEKMRKTEELREKELGRPFSVISSNPKYNADYLEHIVKTKWLKKLNEMEATNNDYVDAYCVGVDVDGHTAVHWVAVKSIGKSVFSNAVDAAKFAAEMSDYYDKHYSFGGKQIKRTQWEHFLEKD